jgi:RNA polymerase sigma-70 factor, ECF subfamily
MSTPNTHEVTDLLLAWSDGDQAALDHLAPLVQSELRRLARTYMRRERAGHTLQTTALINEVYLRLIDAKKISWQNRAHFYGIAARLMRRVLVDCARERNYQKRGGGAFQVTFNEALAVGAAGNPDILALDEALSELAKIYERKAQVVEMRFFGGLKEKEIAMALGVSPETVRRDWRLARSWLLRKLNKKNDEQRILAKS